MSMIKITFQKMGDAFDGWYFPPQITFQFHFLHPRTRVYVALWSGGEDETVLFGETTCHPKDEWSYEQGMRHALRNIRSKPWYCSGRVYDMFRKWRYLRKLQVTAPKVWVCKDCLQHKMHGKGIDLPSWIITELYGEVTITSRSCMSQGDTPSSPAMCMIEAAMRGWLEVELEDGEDIPLPEEAHDE